MKPCWKLTPAMLLAIALTLTHATAADVIDVPWDQPTIADAIAVAQNGDEIDVYTWDYELAFEPLIDYAGKAITIRVRGPFDMPADGLYLLADDAALESMENYETGTMLLSGEIRSPQSGTCAIRCFIADVNQPSSGRILVAAGVHLDFAVLDGPDRHIVLEGQLYIDAGGSAEFSPGPFGYVAHSGNVVLFDGAALRIWEDLFTVTGHITATHSTIRADGLTDSHGSWIMNGGEILALGGLDNAGLINLLAGDVTLGDDLDNSDRFRMITGFLLGQDIFNDGTPEDRAELAFDDVTILAATLYNGLHGDVFGSGDWYVEIVNEGEFTFAGDTAVTGSALNDGTITVDGGTWTLFGPLTNHGIIVAHAPGGRGAGLAVDIDGACTVTPDGGLLLGAGAGLRVDGDFDLAIDSHERFAASDSTITLRGASPTTMEVMSTDLGATSAGLDPTRPGHYPVGTLVIDAAHLTLVEQHENDGIDGAAEALYVDTLIVPSGATLDAAGHRVYYRTLINDGTILHGQHMAPIPDPVPGDLDCSGQADIHDINPFVLALSSPAGYAAVYPECDRAAADINGDGAVDIHDINPFVVLLSGR